MRIHSSFLAILIGEFIEEIYCSGNFDSQLKMIANTELLKGWTRDINPFCPYNGKINQVDQLVDIIVPIIGELDKIHAILQTQKPIVRLMLYERSHWLSSYFRNLNEYLDVPADLHELLKWIWKDSWPRSDDDPNLEHFIDLCLTD